MTRRSAGLSPEERRRTLLADIDALPVAKGSRLDGLVRTQTDFLHPVWGFVAQAARDRRVSTPAYLRRAALAMACHDLEVPLADALARDPRMSRETGLGVPDPDDVRFGPWEIVALRGEAR